MGDQPPPPSDRPLRQGYTVHNQAQPDRQHTPTAVDGLKEQHIHQASLLTLTPPLEPTFEFSDLFDDQYDADANFDPGDTRRFPYSDLHDTAAGAGVDRQPLECGSYNAQVPSQLHAHYNSPNRTSVSGPPTVNMHSQAYASHSVPVGSTQYAPFSGAFPDSESATQHRKIATRFNRMPYRPPDGDPTIEVLASSRQVQVKRIYDAMTRSDAAKDNTGSIAMRRWAHAAFYPSELVEAFAHKVFDCLLNQAHEGFRGWHHNDYASDDRKGEPEDKDVSCAERLDNIIRGLEEEKTICEDVMTSACQIRMFVNAPRAYARRKEANRHGNSKRGKVVAIAKPDTSSRAARSRKLNTRQAARARQSTPSAASPPSASHVLRDIEPNLRSPVPPYYRPAQHLQSPPIPHYTPSMTNPHGRMLSGYHPTVISPPQPLANSMGLTSMSPRNLSPFVSPPPVAPTSMPATPDEQKRVNDMPSTTWPTTDFSTHSHNMFPHDGTGFDFNLFADAPQFGDMQLHEPAPQSPKDDHNIDPIFRDFWDNQHNVHPIPHGQPGDQ